MSRPGTDALRAHRAATSRLKRLSVLASIDELAKGVNSLTVAAVARHAGVSREFIHSHDELLDALRTAAKKQLETPRPGVEGPTRLEKRLMAEKRTLLGTVGRNKALLEQQAGELATLRGQRRRWLGEQLEPAIDPDEHRELRIINDRLTTEVATQNAEIAELRRSISILESDLSASRQAHAETVHELLQSETNVTSIGRPG